jgi:hypothetical protein
MKREIIITSILASSLTLSSTSIADDGLDKIKYGLGDSTLFGTAELDGETYMMELSLDRIFRNAHEKQAFFLSNESKPVLSKMVAGNMPEFMIYYDKGNLMGYGWNDAGYLDCDFDLEVNQERNQTIGFTMQQIQNGNITCNWKRTYAERKDPVVFTMDMIKYNDYPDKFPVYKQGHHQTLNKLIEDGKRTGRVEDLKSATQKKLYTKDIYTYVGEVSSDYNHPVYLTISLDQMAWHESSSHSFFMRTDQVLTMSTSKEQRNTEEVVDIDRRMRTLKGLSVNGYSYQVVDCDYDLLVNSDIDIMKRDHTFSGGFSCKVLHTSDFLTEILEVEMVRKQ